MCCTVSVSILQNLQDGSPLNRSIIRRCPLIGACPVRIATAIFSWCLPNLSRSSALFLHGLPIKSLPCLPPGPWLSVSCDGCLLSGRDLCDELITRPEESYRMWCVVVFDLETSWMRRPWPGLGRSATKKNSVQILHYLSPSQSELIKNFAHIPCFSLPSTKLYPYRQLEILNIP